jgi:hypothetical protein
MTPREALLHGIPYQALAISFFLQIGPSQRAGRARGWPRVPSLMYPSRTRGPLPVLKTHNRKMDSLDRHRRLVPMLPSDALSISASAG